MTFLGFILLGMVFGTSIVTGAAAGLRENSFVGVLLGFGIGLAIGTLATWLAHRVLVSCADRIDAIGERYPVIAGALFWLLYLLIPLFAVVCGRATLSIAQMMISTIVR